MWLFRGCTARALNISICYFSERFYSKVSSSPTPVLSLVNAPRSDDFMQIVGAVPVRARKPTLIYGMPLGNRRVHSMYLRLPVQWDATRAIHVLLGFEVRLSFSGIILHLGPVVRSHNRPCCGWSSGKNALIILVVNF